MNGSKSAQHERRPGWRCFLRRQRELQVDRVRAKGRSGEMLCSKNAIHGIERKLAAAVEEIGKMRLAEPGLTRQ